MKIGSLIMTATLLLSSMAFARPNNNCVADAGTYYTNGVAVLSLYNEADSQRLLRSLKSNSQAAARKYGNAAGQVMAYDYTLTRVVSTDESPRWPDEGCRAVATKALYCSDGKTVACSEICVTQKSCIDPR